jgi:hypothetical protein
MRFLRSARWLVLAGMLAGCTVYDTGPGYSPYYYGGGGYYSGGYYGGYYRPYRHGYYRPGYYYYRNCWNCW